MNSAGVPDQWSKARHNKLLLHDRPAAALFDRRPNYPVLLLLPLLLHTVVSIRASTSRPYSALSFCSLTVGFAEGGGPCNTAPKCRVARTCMSSTLGCSCAKSPSYAAASSSRSGPSASDCRELFWHRCMLSKTHPHRPPVLVAPRSSTFNDSSESQRSNATRKLGPHACDLMRQAMLPIASA